jgi:23S rRNA (uracil1939-C5)-methyltransferase
MKIKKGDELTLTIDAMAIGGKGIARMEGLVVFVDGAVPGDTVRARIMKVKSQFLEARNIGLVEASAARTAPRCRYAGSCGGCKMQHIRYDVQLQYKHRHVRDAFERIGNLRDVAIPEPIGSGDIYLYRNKMEYSFSDQRWLTPAEIESGDAYNKNFALGLHAPGRFDKVIDIEECWLQSHESNRIAASLRRAAIELNVLPYSTRTHEGFLRFAVIRQSRAGGGIMVNIVTADHRQDIMQPIVDRLRVDVPEVTTIVNTVNRKKAQVAVGDEEIVYYGDGRITERIGRYTFRISAHSFFQTNTGQTERLYTVAKEFGGLSEKDVALDLYCGTGSIAIFLSDAVGSVYGVESVADSVGDANENAALNNVTNVRFIHGDVLDMLKDRASWMGGQPTVLYLDPPRSGVHPKAIGEILRLNVPRIVYISCNPVTQARDIAALCERGYRLDRMQPVDMFPHTYHIENVAALRLES